jgi:hypothetical protein
MKGFVIILFGVLLQLTSLEQQVAAHQDKDCFSASHAHFEMVAQTESWGAVNNLLDSENLKKIQSPDFSVFTGKISIPAHICAAGYTSRAKKATKPLRYQLCVLRL